MKDNNLFTKTIQFLTITSLILWLGTYIARHLVIYQLFEPEGLVLRSNFNEQNLNAVWITISPLIVSGLILFPLFILFFVIYLFLSKVSLKKEGWLFISCLIIFVTAPFEIFLLVKDYKIIQNVFANSFDTMHLLSMIKERVTILSSFSLIEIFAYLIVVFLSIFKPLTK